MKRREFVKRTIAGGAALTFAGRPGLAFTLTPPTLTKYVDALPLVPPIPQSRTYTITMSEFHQKLHRDLPPTRLWGYNGSFLGPRIEATRGVPVSVTWVNNLPSKHIFDYAIDPTIHGSEPGQPQVRTVVHLHGAKVLPQFDGYPESWFTNAATNVNGPNYRVYQYPNDQQATMLWYHDHSLGSTRFNVYAGLVGTFFIREAQEASFGLPSADYEIPLVIVDRQFEIDPLTNLFTGNLLYPDPSNAQVPGFPTAGVTPHHPHWATELWADTALVNGKVWPYLNVEPRKYRFRILNASNARFYNLQLVNKTTGAGLPFLQIGSDQGFLPAPVHMNQLLMGIAERMDVIVDFSGMHGQTITMMNPSTEPLNSPGSCQAPYPSGGGGPDIPELMQFRVTRQKTGDSIIPAVLSAAAPLSQLKHSVVRDIRLDEIEDDEMDEKRDPLTVEDPNDPQDESDETGSPVIGMLELKHWAAPVSIQPKIGSVEIWRFINTTPDTHPIHVHLVHFEVLSRECFDVDYYKSTGVIRPPLTPCDPTRQVVMPNEINAPKDVVRVEQGTITSVIMKFDMPQGTITFPGEKFRYILHCHILEHEDNEMMRPFDVVV